MRTCILEDMLLGLFPILIFNIILLFLPLSECVALKSHGIPVQNMTKQNLKIKRDLPGS